MSAPAQAAAAFADVARYLGEDAIEGIVAFQVVVLVIVLGNMWVWHRLRAASKRAAGPAGAPLVSVLVPCRNEEVNVRGCMRSLLAQRHPRLEIIALDDHSEDATLAILEEERAQDARLRVLCGEPLPDGWLGKNWACHQLASAAHGDVLLFVDADTVLEPDAVERLLAVLDHERAALVSGIPRQILGSAGEELLVPVFCWALVSFMPLITGYLAPRRLAARATVPSAVGQLMMFRRDAYAAIGGHAAIRGGVVDDLDLARAVRRAGLTARLMDAGQFAHCRMYRSATESYRGFRKNLFGVFGYAVLPYAFVWLWLAWVYLEPLVAAVLWQLTAAVPGTPGVPPLLAVTVALSFAQWVLVYARLRLPVWPALLYPFTMLAFDALALGSFAGAVKKTASWRGRIVDRPRIKVV